MALELWKVTKGQFRPHLDSTELINLCKKIPLNYNSECFFHLYSSFPLDNDRKQKMSLYFDVVYGFDIQVEYKIAFELINIDSHVTKNGKILDISESNYFHSNLDPATTYLIEAITNLKERRFIDGFPKLVMWLDKYVEKDASGFCEVRNSCIHPDLFSQSRQKLEDSFPNQLDFEDDDSLKRNSGKNFQFLESKMTVLLKEIRPHFLKKFFENETLLENCEKDKEFIKTTYTSYKTMDKYDLDVDGRKIIR